MRSGLLALSDLFLAMLNLVRRHDQRNEVSDLGTELLDFGIVDMEEEKGLGLLGKSIRSVKSKSEQAHDSKMWPTGCRLEYGRNSKGQE